jgi:hypothetical protein
MKSIGGTKQDINRLIDQHGKKEVKSSYGSEREKRTSLKKILKKIKVKRLVFLFYSKLKRTIVRDIEKDLTIEDTKS